MLCSLEQLVIWIIRWGGQGVCEFGQKVKGEEMDEQDLKG